MPGSSAAALRWLALFLVPFLALAVVHWDWSPATSASDYAQYLMHARAILEGRPYGDIGYIYVPAAGLIGPPTLPPGLPLTLAPLVALGGVHTPLVRLLMLASVLAFAALATWRLARDVAPWQAALAGAFSAYAIEASGSTLAPISDPGFAALVWGTVIAVDSEGAWTWRRVAAVIALGFAALSYRVVGIALVPGLLLYALLQRRRVGMLPFTPPALWTAAGVIGLAAGLVHIPFIDRLARSIGDPGHHLSTFADQYRVGLFLAQLYPFSSNAANDGYHALASLLALLGLALIVWRARRSFMVTFAAAYCAVLLVAPVAEPRYAWPLFPLVGASLAYGTTLVVRRIAPSAPSRTQALAAALPLVALLLITLWKDARRPAPAAFVRHADARALFVWLSQRRGATTDVPMRVAYHNPRVVALESDVRAMGIVPRTAPGLLTALKHAGATHLIWQRTGLGNASNPGLLPCVQRVANTLPDLYPDYFTLEYHNPTFRVYRMHPDPGAVDEPGERISWSDC